MHMRPETVIHITVDAHPIESRLVRVTVATILVFPDGTTCSSNWPGRLFQPQHIAQRQEAG